MLSKPRFACVLGTVNGFSVQRCAPTRIQQLQLRASHLPSVLKHTKIPCCAVLCCAAQIPMRLNYTLTKVINGDTPPMTLVGNVYELYGDIWEDVPNWQQKWLGR